jgi:hypothetical protein
MTYFTEHKITSHPGFINLLGQTFGRLTVIFRGENDKRGRAQWICECECGNHSLIRGNELRSGHTQSCGCLQKEIATQCSTMHGMRHTVEYRAYHAAKNRCENPKYADYKNYGGRGIKFLYVSFEEFFEDMGICPPGKTLDRYPDKNGHYQKGNCRWATSEEQANNTRKNVWITFDGRTQTIAQWARETGIDQHALGKRLRRGWSPDDALTRPVRKTHK